ncbi:MAG: hypothetical protein AAGE98_11585 [Actinomycetota bacterium]
MLAAQAVFEEGRRAVIDTAGAVIAADATADPVARFRPRRPSRRRRIAADPNIPATKLDAVRFAATFVASNHAVLDAAEAASPETLDPAVAVIEAEIADLDATEALARFTDDTPSLLDRIADDADLDVTAVYPVARTASDLAAFVAVELHLAARMLDPTHAPDDARALMRTLNEALRSMLGHGIEDWFSVRFNPWRQMVIRRGLAWP